MTNRIAVLASAALASAAALALSCATKQQETTGEPVVRMISNTVTNQTWFDLANCFGQPPAVPNRATDGVLLGLLQSANPQIMECAAEPKNRGPKEQTVITVTSNVPESGVAEHTIRSDNLTPEGETCVRGVLAKVVPAFTQKAVDELKLGKGERVKKEKKVEVVDVGERERAKAAAAAARAKAKAKGKGKGKGKQPEPEPAPEQPAPPPEEKVVVDPDEEKDLKDLPPGVAAAQVRFVHDVKAHPTIRGDVNETSVAAGQIRLALPTMCSCFEPWRDADPVPFQLIAVLPHLTTQSLPDGGSVAPPATEQPSTVTITVPEGDATTATVAACVKDQVAKMTFKTPSEREAQVPYNFQFINSASGKPMSSGESWVKYQQIEELSRRRAAESAISKGARISAANLYNQLVEKFKKNNYSVTVKTLTGRCQDLLKADDAWLATVQKQMELEQQRKELVAALVKEDSARWGSAEKTSGRAMEATTKEIDEAKGARKADEAACPVLKE
jgi:hypothetical protein